MGLAFGNPSLKQACGAKIALNSERKKYLIFKKILIQVAWVLYAWLEFETTWE